jgi:predicted metal-dependent HD superfamily phosphohydrolase
MSRTNFFTINAGQIQVLQMQWRHLVEQYNADVGIAEALFNMLVGHYSEKGRLYHNLSHIKALLDQSAAYKNDIDNGHAVFFAIWFHDAIYNTRENENEERSAALAVQTLTQLAVPGDTILLVQKMILATKHHQADKLGADGRLFLDFDLSILGRKAAIYKDYSQAIRMEYAWVPEALYRQGRQKVLNSFLQREKIYYTDQLAELFEAQARQNMERELTELARESG